MTLDEAIKHCEEVAESQQRLGDSYDYWDGDGEKDKADECFECAEEHRQLAEWLRKYQKIEQILDDYDLEAWEILEKIKEVVRAW